MIEEVLQKLNGKFNDISYVGGSSHTIPLILDGIEQELTRLPTKYKRRVPSTYPTGTGEEMGLRSLRFPADVSYLGMALRVGITELHLADTKTNENVKAVAMFYMGGSEVVNVGPVKGKSVTDTSSVAIMENGVVSACYYANIAGGIVPIFSWYPECKKGYAALPYPSSKVDVSELTQDAFRSLGLDQDVVNIITDTKAFRALPDCVMLCVDTYKEMQAEG